MSVETGEDHPLPPEIIENVCAASHLNLIALDTAAYRHLNKSRMGIPQGSAVSSLIAEFAVASALEHTPKGVEFQAFVDNILCSAANERMARLHQSTLERQLLAHPSGFFSVKSSGVGRPSPRAFHFSDTCFGEGDAGFASRLAIPNRMHSECGSKHCGTGVIWIAGRGQSRPKGLFADGVRLIDCGNRSSAWSAKFGSTSAIWFQSRSCVRRLAREIKGGHLRKPLELVIAPGCKPFGAKGDRNPLDRLCTILKRPQ